MGKLTRTWGLIAVLAMGAVSGVYLQHTASAQDKGEKAQAKAAQGQKWEYRILLWAPTYEGQGAFESKLNKLGEEGFEIASQTSVVVANTATHNYTLKRLKKD